MPRYFIALSYKGTRYRGFQWQQNALTVQEEVGKALLVLLNEEVELTGSSRTDAGVHARQNYFHFDLQQLIREYRGIKDENQFVYKMNAILPPDIALQQCYRVNEKAHCRFDAQKRLYRYYIYHQKDPFEVDRAYYYPYPLDLSLLQAAATMLMQFEDFTSFSKRNTQVKTFICRIERSLWKQEGGLLVYEVAANRFLRGMVRALTATMLQVGRGIITLEEFRHIIEAKDCTKASFAVPAHGLVLEGVSFPPDYFSAT